MKKVIQSESFCNKSLIIIKIAPTETKETKMPSQ